MCVNFAVHLNGSPLLNLDCFQSEPLSRKVFCIYKYKYISCCLLLDKRSCCTYSYLLLLFSNPKRQRLQNAVSLCTSVYIHIYVCVCICIYTHIYVFFFVIYCVFLISYCLNLSHTYNFCTFSAQHTYVTSRYDFCNLSYCFL